MTLGLATGLAIAKRLAAGVLGCDPDDVVVSLRPVEGRWWCLAGARGVDHSHVAAFGVSGPDALRRFNAWLCPGAARAQPSN